MSQVVDKVIAEGAELVAAITSVLDPGLAHLSPA